MHVHVHVRFMYACACAHAYKSAHVCARRCAGASDSDCVFVCVARSKARARVMFEWRVCVTSKTGNIRMWSSGRAYQSFSRTASKTVRILHAARELSHSPLRPKSGRLEKYKIQRSIIASIKQQRQDEDTEWAGTMSALRQLSRT